MPRKNRAAHAADHDNPQEDNMERNYAHEDDHADASEDSHEGADTHDGAAESDVTSKVIKLGAAQITVPLPYKEGHVVTAAEARALNQTRLENIRNALTAKAKAASEKNLDLADLMPEFERYANEYEFTISGRGIRVGSFSRDPVDVEERRLAKDMIRTQLQARNVVLKDVSKEQWDAYIQMYLDKGYFRAQAEANVKARERAMAEAGDFLTEVPFAQAAD